MFEPTFEKGPDFNRARSQIATPFQYIDIALDVATSNSIVNISGDFLYVDPSSTGIATLELNNQYNDKAAPFYIQSGFALQAMFKQVKLSWAAQAGKFIRLLYSTGDRVVPAFSAALQITGSVQVRDGGDVYDTNHISNANLAANTPQAVFVAAGNTNGILVISARGFGYNAASGSNLVLIAKATAPASITDGSVICSGIWTSSACSEVDLKRPVIVPAGLGLYWINSIADTSTTPTLRSVLYKNL